MNAQAQRIMPAIPAETKTEIVSLTDLATDSRKLVISNHEDYQRAADLLKDIKARGKELDKKRKAITDPLDQAKKSTMDLFRPATSAVAELEKDIKAKMSGFIKKIEREKAEAQAKAEAAARLERERIETKSDKLRDQGKEELANAVESHADAVVAAPVQEIKISGAHHRKIWKARLVNKMDLIKAVAAGQASPELLDYKESVGNGLAKALKSGLNVPGLEPYTDVSIASR